MTILRHGDPATADRWQHWSNVTRFTEASRCVHDSLPLPPDVTMAMIMEFASRIEGATPDSGVLDIFDGPLRPEIQCSDCGKLSALVVELGDTHWGKHVFCRACLEKALHEVNSILCSDVAAIARPDIHRDSQDQAGGTDGEFMMKL